MGLKSRLKKIATADIGDIGRALKRLPGQSEDVPGRLYRSVRGGHGLPPRSSKPTPGSGLSEAELIAHRRVVVPSNPGDLKKFQFGLLTGTEKQSLLGLSTAQQKARITSLEPQLKKRAGELRSAITAIQTAKPGTTVFSAAAELRRIGKEREQLKRIATRPGRSLLARNQSAMLRGHPGGAILAFTGDVRTERRKMRAMTQQRHAGIRAEAGRRRVQERTRVKAEQPRERPSPPPAATPLPPRRKRARRLF